MTIIVGETERAALKEAMARARTYPVPWEMLEGGVVEGTDSVRIEDGSPRHKRPLPEQVALPFGYLVAISLRRTAGWHLPARLGLRSVAEKAAEYGGLRDDLYSARCTSPGRARMDRTIFDRRQTWWPRT